MNKLQIFLERDWREDNSVISGATYVGKSKHQQIIT